MIQGLSPDKLAEERLKECPSCHYRPAQNLLAVGQLAAHMDDCSARPSHERKRLDNLFDIARKRFHYAPRGTPDGTMFERSETGRLLRRAIDDVATALRSLPIDGESRNEVLTEAHWIIFDHISSLYRTDESKARELDRALAHLSVRLGITMPSAALSTPQPIEGEDVVERIVTWLREGADDAAEALCDAISAENRKQRAAGEFVGHPYFEIFAAAIERGDYRAALSAAPKPGDLGVSPAGPGHSGFAPSPDGLGHSESVPDAEALASLLENRCDQTFDGECHLSTPEAKQIADWIRHADVN
jgi:hypothetical protein